MTTIPEAWAVIEACEHRNPDDGCCSHPNNPTPECHGAICPVVNAKTGSCRHCGAEIVNDDLNGWVHRFSYQQQCHDGAPERAAP